jgi:hypothetical protein
VRDDRFDVVARRTAGGRPTKLTAEVRKKILATIEAGSTLKDAAAYAGICDETLRIWRRDNPDFAAEFYRAEGVAAVAYTLAVKRASDNGDWRAAAWWLERRCPEEWSLKQIHEVGGKEGAPIPHEHGFTLDPKHCTVEELELLERLMLRQMAALPEA